jgi:hypothetical protein
MNSLVSAPSSGSVISMIGSPSSLTSYEHDSVSISCNDEQKRTSPRSFLPGVKSAEGS